MSSFFRVFALVSIALAGASVGQAAKIEPHHQRPQLQVRTLLFVVSGHSATVVMSFMVAPAWMVERRAS
jgi:hypothetical protein